MKVEMNEVRAGRLEKREEGKREDEGEMERKGG